MILNAVKLFSETNLNQLSKTHTYVKFEFAFENKLQNKCCRNTITKRTSVVLQTKQKKELNIILQSERKDYCANNFYMHNKVMSNCFVFVAIMKNLMKMM